MLAVWPHMHQFGTHAHLTLVPSGTNTVDIVLDKDFTFDDQTNSMITERVLHADDALNFTCSYQVPGTACSAANPCTYGTCLATGFCSKQCDHTNSNKLYCLHGSCGADDMCHVAYGESSVGEMCYAALYMWPPAEQTYGCVNGVSPI
jgi:hypothetical protein